ncbi:olfactory receptor 6M1-like [Hyla sarda]|uniref:olfactory receptor 6M1-like n=1 Tax=Hyla sarda TaxID=327740 RepID=UPI0024C27498|nr:olfactory receptor 6M1-like [Hyla sarda]
MASNNFTSELEFHILGFSSVLATPFLSFFILLVIYIFNVSGNSLIIVVTRMDYNLYKPMYFFLGSLALVDMSFTTVTLPKLMEIFLNPQKTICFVCCMMQMYFFLSVGVTESFHLAAMSYDRYLAICNSLQYNRIMTNRVCVFMVLGCWISGFSSVLLPVILISRLQFCNLHINHFFCDISPVIQLSCCNTKNLEMFIFLTAFIVILGTFSVIVFSYVKIVISILRISTSSGKKKAFSTCISHLITFLIYYGTIIFMYVRPKSKSDLDIDKKTAVFYSIISPTLNPLIYTLRNNEIKNSLKKNTYCTRESESVTDKISVST